MHKAMTSSLFLVRHGKAMTESQDSSRPLSPQGVKELEKLAKYLSAQNIQVDEILHSNKLRARQTAEILSKHIDSAKRLREAGGLSPMDDPQPWMDELTVSKDKLMLVGHLPFMSRLASLLLTRRMNSSCIVFYPGTVAAFRNSGGDWAVEWVIPASFKS
jgi:phosphohistidine phosphatase